MSTEPTPTPLAWARSHTRAVVVALSAVVLVAGSAISISRAGSDDGDLGPQQLQAEGSATPSPTVTTTPRDDAPRRSAGPASRAPSGSPSATPSATATASASASASASPAAPGRSAEPVAPVAPRPVTTSSRPVTPVEPTAPRTTSPPASEAPTRASVLIVNNTDQSVTFRVGSSAGRIIFANASTRLVFTVSPTDQDRYELFSLTEPSCGANAAGDYGLEGGGSYRIEVVTRKDACTLDDGTKADAPGLADLGSWPRA